MSITTKSREERLGSEDPKLGTAEFSNSWALRMSEERLVPVFPLNAGVVIRVKYSLRAFISGNRPIFPRF